MDQLERPLSRRTLLQRGAAGAVGLYAAGAFGLAGRAAGDTSDVTLNWLTWSDHYFPEQLQEVQKATGIGARAQLFSDDADAYIKVKAGGGGWDISSEDALWVPKFYNEGLIEAFDIKSFPVAKQLYSAALDVPFWKAGSNQMGYPFGWSSVQIYYNPKYVKTEPELVACAARQAVREEDRAREPADRPDGDGRHRHGCEEAVRHDRGRDLERQGLPRAAEAQCAQARVAEPRGDPGAHGRVGLVDGREHRHRRAREGRGRPADQHRDAEGRPVRLDGRGDAVEGVPRTRTPSRSSSTRWSRRSGSPRTS